MARIVKKKENFPTICRFGFSFMGILYSNIGINYKVPMIHFKPTFGFFELIPKGDFYMVKRSIICNSVEKLSPSIIKEIDDTRKDLGI